MSSHYSQLVNQLCDRNDFIWKLSEEQKEFNKNLASQRIVVEHAIGGMKFFHCLKNVWRGYLHNLDDLVIWLCAGLWNARLRPQFS